MPPLDFPSSPTNGQEYQGYVYSTSVGAWQAKPAAQSPFYTSDTPPANPTKGDSWFNTNDGTMYVYVYDGNTYQWVEHRSQIARSQVGLVPVAPTSIAVGSGTATTGLLGRVTFTGVNSVSLNGVFTSAYTKYRIITHVTGSSIEDMQNRFRLRNVSDNSSLSYSNAVPLSQNSGAYNSLYSVNIGYTVLGNSSSFGVSLYSMDIVNPFLSARTVWHQSTFYHTSAAFFGGSGGGFHTDSYSADGFTIYPVSGTFTGNVQVFGYNE